METRRRNYSRPKLGQHFLNDDQVVQNIVALANLQPDSNVVEIGPGEGVLTRALSAVVTDGLILAIELDGTLAFNLREKVSKRVKILHADAVRFDYETVVKPYHVVSNLPYQVTSPVLHALAGSKNPPESMTLMMQREVADRLLATPKHRERGLLTVVAEWYGTVTKGFDVPPTAFNPPPKVWSTVVRLERSHDERPPFDQFLKFLRVGFSQKRRQIHHPFLARFPMLKPNFDELLAQSGVERTQRAEELSFDQWVALFNIVFKYLTNE